MDLVSIIVPTYNQSFFLNLRVVSILNQTYKNYEIIFLDDNSTDNSLSILNAYKNHPKVKFILSNKPNSRSPFGLWKQGMELAQGYLIWIAEADDFCEPDFLENIVKGFDDPDVVVSHCRSWDYRSELNYKKNQWWDSFGTDLWEKDFNAEGRELIKRFGRFKSPVINVSSAIFRKSALDGVEIPSSYKYCGDWWFWAQIFMKGKVAYTAVPLNYFRIHENSATAYNNLNVLLRASEATSISKKVNEVLKTNFKYSKNYEWLVDFWFAALLSNKSIAAVQEFKSQIPKSFWIPVFKKIFNYYYRKLIN